jgi:hypothetical protein
VSAFPCEKAATEQHSNNKVMAWRIFFKFFSPVEQRRYIIRGLRCQGVHI